MSYTIYALFDEREQLAVRYIGFSENPAKRFQYHIAEAQWSLDRSHRLNWLRKLAREGSKPGWRVLAVVETADQAAAAEIGFIAGFRAAGCDLINGTEGGEGVQGQGGRLSPEALARRNASLNSEAYLAERSASSQAYWAEREHREHQSEAMKAVWESERGEEWRASQRALGKAQWQEPGFGERVHTPDARAKMAAAKLGKPHARERTPEWNAKIAIAQKGIKRGPMSEDHKNKHASALSSEATRAKMRASALARHARAKLAKAEVPDG